MFSEDVRRDRGREVVPELILVGTCGVSEFDRVAGCPPHLPILDIHHPLCMCITEVTLVRQPEVDLGLVQRVCDLVWEDACRQARHDFLGILGVCSVEDVVVDDEVVAEECGLNRSECQIFK